MGSYMVRYKGVKVKGAFKPGGKKVVAEEGPDDTGDVGAEEMTDTGDQAAQPPARKKAPPPFQPEKAVVANMVGTAKPPAKKKGAVPPQFAKKETGEKGNAKSGNYGHAGIPGHQGGSAPKGSGAGGAASTSAPAKRTVEKVPKWLDPNLPGSHINKLLEKTGVNQDIAYSRTGGNLTGINGPMYARYITPPDMKVSKRVLMADLKSASTKDEVMKTGQVRRLGMTGYEARAGDHVYDMHSSEGYFFTVLRDVTGKRGQVSLDIVPNKAPTM